MGHICPAGVGTANCTLKRSRNLSGAECGGVANVTVERAVGEVRWDGGGGEGGTASEEAGKGPLEEGREGGGRTWEGV